MGQQGLPQGRRVNDLTTDGGQAVHQLLRMLFFRQEVQDFRQNILKGKGTQPLMNRRRQFLSYAAGVQIVHGLQQHASYHLMNPLPASTMDKVFC